LPKEVQSKRLAAGVKGFNIGGDKYRLIAAIHYNTAVVYVRNVLTHAAYDRERWKGGCQ